MLAWLSRHLPFLRLVPGLPQIFDALLMGGTALRHPERLAAMHHLEMAVLSWPGVGTKVHRFGGTEFTLNTAQGPREIGHLHGNGLLDIPFTKTIREEVVQAGRAQPHHVFPQSAWVSVSLRSQSDVPNAVGLLRRSYNCRQSLGGAALFVAACPSEDHPAGAADAPDRGIADQDQWCSGRSAGPFEANP